MEEATEIARLRLFLALVATAQTVDQLEPLPNIDFNVVSGNSLVGLLHVDAHEFDGKTGAQADFFRKSYRQVLEEKNRKVDVYRHTASQLGAADLSALKADIEQHRCHAQSTLNEVLLDVWHQAGIRFEQSTWDMLQGKEGKPVKRPLQCGDMAALQPFHWGFEFDEILNTRGGFDAIITNPPWEIFKPNAKEFFQEHSSLVSKNSMTIKAFEKEQAKLLKDSTLRAAWLAYLSRFAHVSAWFRAASQFKHQSAVVNGKKTGSDINLYKLFTEQCLNLLREGGELGIVIPSGIYTDLGAKGLRDLLFDHNRVTGLFGFENRKEIFEGVDSRFKFVVLTVEKGGCTERFPATFMRHEVSELAGFPDETGLALSVELIRRLSPDSHSVMEFKSETDILIAEKMIAYPLLGEKIDGVWNIKLSNEFHMTNDSHLFHTEPGHERLPLFEGKMIHQFVCHLAKPRYWVSRSSVIKALGNATALDYKLVYRAIGRNTDTRTMIGTILPQESVFGNSLNGSGTSIPRDTLPYIAAVLNSFMFDYFLRLQVTANLNMFFIYSSRVPRLQTTDERFQRIATRAAKLICITPEFDDLAREVGLASHRAGAHDEAERSRLRAELDGLIAHLYGLTEAEFAHVLKSFPLVPEPTRLAALNAWRDVEKGLLP